MSPKYIPIDDSEISKNIMALGIIICYAIILHRINPRIQHESLTHVLRVRNDAISQERHKTLHHVIQIGNPIEGLLRISA